jgi:hypothetical protein
MWHTSPTDSIVYSYLRLLRSMVKCRGVLQCRDGLSNKVSNIIRRLMDNMKLLLICILLLSHSFIFFRYYFYQCMYGFIPVWYFNLCIFIVMTMYSYCMFTYGYSDWGFSVLLLSCKANARVNKTRKDGARPALFLIFVLFYVLFVLCRSVYCLCVNVYCTTATGWLPNCS